MRSESQQENCFRALMLDKLEYNSQVVPRAASPSSFQFAFELVGFEAGMEAIRGEQVQDQLKFLANFGFFFNSFFARPRKAVERSKSRVTRESLSLSLQAL